MSGSLGLAAFAVAGATLSGHATAGVPQADPVKATAQHVLAAWQDYPVKVRPRPIVLVDPDGRVQHPEPKRPADQVRIDTGAYQLPSGLSSHDGVQSGYHLISQRAAARRLPIATPATPPRTPRLRVAGVTLGAGHFPTDRPAVAYPAWLFRVSGFRSPTRVLATPAWPAPVERQATLPADVLINQEGESATASEGGRSLRLSFIGTTSGSGPCDQNYTARTYSSPTAVVPVVFTHSTAPRTGHGVWCAGVGVERHITVRLTEPLGARVVVNVVNRDPIPVVGRS